MPRKAPKFEGAGAVADFPALRRNAERDVASQLGRIARPEDRIRRAAEIVLQADADLGVHQGERNRAVASLYFYDHLEGTSLAKAIGVNKNALRKVFASVAYGDARAQLPPRMTDDELTSFARQHNMPHVENAAQKLPELGRIVEKAKARRSAAVRAMQDTVMVLSSEPYNWSPEKIAEYAGVERELIYKQRATARKRHGL